MTMDWIAAFTEYRGAALRERQHRALARAVYPTAWGGPHNPAAEDPMGFWPRTANGWAERGLRAVETCTAGVV